MDDEVQPTPEPGIYYGVSDAEYDSWTAIRRSTLDFFCEGNTAADAFHLMFRAPEKSASHFDEGTALHLATLQPEEFEAQVVQMIPGPFQSNAAKAAKAEFLEQHANKVILSPKDYAEVLRMKDSLLRYRMTRELLTAEGKNEVAIVWDDAEWGFRCKVKLDRILRRWRGYMTVLELKSIHGRATPENVRRQVGEMGYHRQEAMYRRGVEAHTGPCAMHFAFIFVGKAAPSVPRVYFLDSDDVQQGREELTEAAKLYANCTKANIWPGPGTEPAIVGLPAWKRRQRGGW